MFWYWTQSNYFAMCDWYLFVCMPTPSQPTGLGYRFALLCYWMSHLFLWLTAPKEFLTSDLLWKYWIDLVAIRKICRGVSGLAPGCPCGVWCCGLSTCPVYLGQFLANRLYWQLVCTVHIVENNFSLLWIFVDNIHLCLYVYHQSISIGFVLTPRNSFLFIEVLVFSYP